MKASKRNIANAIAKAERRQSKPPALSKYAKKFIPIEAKEAAKG